MSQISSYLLMKVVTTVFPPSALNSLFFVLASCVINKEDYYRKIVPAFQEF